MIRILRLSDIPRQLFLGHHHGPDLVQTRANMLRAPSGVSYPELVREVLFPRRCQCTWVLVKGSRLQALGTVQKRSGLRAWELRHLYLAPNGWDHCEEMLEHCASYSGAQGAERLFLRVPQASPLEQIARRSGFFLCVTEAVYQRRGEASSVRPPPPNGLRPPTASDRYGLFRLYNASTPPQVRSAHGLTLDQWQDAREAVRGQCRDFVYAKEDTLRAWLRLTKWRHTVSAEIMVHPEDGDIVPLLLEFVVQLTPPRHRVMWLVPAYHVPAQRALAEAGFTERAHYTVLVKSAAARIREASLAPAQA